MSGPTDKTGIVQRLRSKHIHFTEVEKCGEAADEIERLRAIGQEADEGGVVSEWVLVPREPTTEMVRAAGGALRTYIESLSDEERAKLKRMKKRNDAMLGYRIAPHIKARIRWRAMIGAMPEPPT